MRDRQLAQVTASKQYREHAFCKHHPRLRMAVESKSVSTQGRGLFYSRTSATEYNGKEVSVSREQGLSLTKGGVKYSQGLHFQLSQCQLKRFLQYLLARNLCSDNDKLLLRDFSNNVGELSGN